MKHVLYAGIAFCLASTLFSLLVSSLICRQVGELWSELDQHIGEINGEVDFVWAEMILLGLGGRTSRILRSAEKESYSNSEKYPEGYQEGSSKYVSGEEKHGSSESKSSEEDKYGATEVLVPPSPVKAIAAVVSESSEIHPPAELPNHCSCVAHDLEAHICPPGPPGRPGPPGKDGHDGLPGVDGYDGFDAYGPAHMESKACWRCPTGTPGPNGPTGAPGVRGRRGCRGQGGTPGISGNPGFPGDIGPPGATGPDGSPGERGPNGLDGVKYNTRRGVKGAFGPMGPEGPPGLKGGAGAIGTPGLTGLTGMTGLMGINGMDGAPGAAGPQGPPGTDATYCKCPERQNEDEAVEKKPGYIQPYNLKKM